MAKQNINSKKGFTIIEVVLVLAIAGLIFLMVFIAWPALQRSQRDTQRRNDYSMLSTAISSFATNNNGKLDKIWTKDGDTLTAATYINEDGTDPDGYGYDLQVYKCTGNNKDARCEDVPEPKRNATTNGSQVFVVIGANCNALFNGHAAPGRDLSSRAFAIYGFLEGGNQTFCSDSQ